MTALVVRYRDGRPTIICDGSADGVDDVCIVYNDDTASDAGRWLFAERGFVRCRSSEALAEVVLVTVPTPDHPADLERWLQVAAAMSNVTWGYVRVAELCAKVG